MMRGGSDAECFRREWDASRAEAGSGGARRPKDSSCACVTTRGLVPHGPAGRAFCARLRSDGAFGTGRSFDTSPLEGYCAVTVGYRRRTFCVKQAYAKKVKQLYPNFGYHRVTY